MRRSGGERFALVAGGGTVGHAAPALAVAEELAARRGCDSVELVGSYRGSGAELFAGSRLPVTLLPGRGIRRSFAPGAMVGNLLALCGLAVGLARSLALVALRRPRVVVALGGFGSIPPALAAVAARVPLVVVNIDVVPGAANRLLARLAAACAVAWPGTDLPRARVTGAPLRREIADLGTAPPGRAAAREKLGLPLDRLVVGAFGGSLGARRLNEAVLDLAKQWALRQDVAIYHVTGKRDRDWAADMSPRIGEDGLVYMQVAYEERMDLLYSAVDVVVCRAGAMTMAELAALGVPAVVVPIPWAPRDHQSANARVLERHGAALVLPDGECTGERLDELLGEILAGTERLSDMAGAARSLGRSGATSAVADLVEEVALGSLGGGRSLRRGRSLRGGRSLRSRHATGEKVPR